MGKSGEEYKSSERPIHLKCQLQLKRDVTLILVPEYNAEPEKIRLKKGTSFTLIDDRQMFCATDHGCGNGPLVKIDESRDADVEDRYIGRSVVIPARFLKLHPNVL